MIHVLKIDPQHFTAVKLGRKKFEIRNNDRDYKVDDIVFLKEWEKRSGYTGREVRGVITYITDFAQQKGYVVFGMDLLDYRS